jgi:TRAP-type mannitol/chloroaromatic compound transport system permease large subunit
MGVGPKGTTLTDVSWAAAPYMVCQIILVALMLAFPWIATVLPNYTQ